MTCCKEPPLLIERGMDLFPRDLVEKVPLLMTSTQQQFSLWKAKHHCITKTRMFVLDIWAPAACRRSGEDMNVLNVLNVLRFSKGLMA